VSVITYSVVASYYLKCSLGDLTCMRLVYLVSMLMLFAVVTDVSSLIVIDCDIPYTDCM